MLKNAKSIPFFPLFPSHQAVRQHFIKYPIEWEKFLQFPPSMQQELLDFCIGKKGLRITYDTVFRKIFQPEIHKERLESLLSSILGRKAVILKVLPREGISLTEKGSFVIMDVLVELDDGSFANVEMQKIGYNFPLARADCYASDIIMRQYGKTKEELGDKFTFAHLHKVYCIVLMEQSPTEFRLAANEYIHRRTSSFDTGIYTGNAGLHEDIFICLDSFHSIVHNITKSSTLQEAWLTFLSATDIDVIAGLVEAFPMFLPIYQEIADYARKPEELMNMLSEALYIMDRNMERLMVEELQEAVAAAKEEARQAVAAAATAKEEKKKAVAAAKEEKKKAVAVTKEEARQAVAAAQAAAKKETTILRLRLAGKSPEEIAEELSISLEEVNKVLTP